MSAVFEAVGTLKIDDRRFAIFGDILNGNVLRGQTVEIPLNKSVSITLDIDSVEFLDLVPEKQSYVALTFRKLDEATIELLESLDIRNEPLEITDR